MTDTTGYTLEANLNSIFQRNIHGVYFEYENKLTEKFSIKPSIRFEYVNREINYEFLNDEIGYYEINSGWNENNPNRNENYIPLNTDDDGDPIGVRQPSWDIYKFNYNLTIFEERYNILHFVGGNCGLTFAR